MEDDKIFTPGGKERLQASSDRENVPYPRGDGKVKLVTADWLADRLHDGNLTIVDIQPNIHDYIQEHIPGATYLTEGVLRVSNRGFPGSYSPTACIQESFRRAGIEADSPVVVYTGKGVFSSRGDGLGQTMMAYTMAKYGHNAVYILDGGLDEWKNHGGELSQEYPPIEPSGFTAELRDDYAISYEEFLRVKDNDDVIVLDARPTKVYEGQGPWRRPGHIPGAVNLPWRSLMDDENPALLRPNDELDMILEDHGVDRSRTVICSCGTGREATNEFVLLKWLYRYPDVRLYEGSFTEWVTHPENPVVEGSEPREARREAVPAR
ncbi:MAG: sulfurtransferase [Methanoculleus sp.]|uniref:sulfurtransferase n=1 Tax=unclassified Methanoculleus TaxID=2619537 RepID=UPI0025CEF0E6|nr:MULTISPECIES: sulfurtransferase [unclassified Methanoculleus]MCK9318621.1 sulfurtransferase [Methanoculleus sp.]MDD2254012.1 sulfurtransferase [Methanoculleus sp.]MDD3216870.1 sulfurtransferase [Methanoculleus sp.]MDD4314988.1 sulfurtransferase [Methanoculleus sp.]MDD4471265.1 sulfurtransferase [Methanoculleus sp.]